MFCVQRSAFSVQRTTYNVQRTAVSLLSSESDILDLSFFCAERSTQNAVR